MGAIQHFINRATHCLWRYDDFRQVSAFVLWPRWRMTKCELFGSIQQPYHSQPLPSGKKQQPPKITWGDLRRLVEEEAKKMMGAP